MNGCETYLPQQHVGYCRIYHDTDIHDTTGIFGQIEYQGKSTQWIHLGTYN